MAGAAQFAACWQRSQQLGMAVGLYRDLAVGVAQHSAETADPQLYKLRVGGRTAGSAGPLGQNWALPPLDPHVLRARAISRLSICCARQYARLRALRIDHVMALLRLWWIPYGECR